MTPPPRRRRGAALAGLLLASAAPLAAYAQTPAPDLSQGRTGPRAAPPPRPAYSRPAPGLGSPAEAAPAPAPAAAAPFAGGGPISRIHVEAEGAHSVARPPRGWTPPTDPGFRLEHQPDQALDEAWVRRQFEVNGLPGEGSVSRALALVQLINRAYLSAGFVNSGLAVRTSPAREVLELRVIYGGLAPPSEDDPEFIVVWADGRSNGLDADYVHDRLGAAFQHPLSALALEREFRLLAEDPALRTVNADLRPGRRPGEASLVVGVYPQDRFDLYANVANSRSPSVGGERISLGGSMRNAITGGDLLSGEVGVTRGQEDATVAYATPFLSPRTSLFGRATVNDAAVIDQPLQLLDISASERSLEGGLTRKLIDQPLLPAGQGRWSPARTLTVGGSVVWRVSKSYLLGERFSFSAGSVNGRSDYTAARLTADYLVRGVDQVFAISLTATHGLDGSRTDVPGLENPKQTFNVGLAQVNYARRLSAGGLELRARVLGQLADGVLYAGERVAAGGETTVRGYRENLLLADEGVIGSIELAQPFSLSGRQGAGRTFDWGAFTVAAFADGAYLHNKSPPQPETALYSVGASVAWTPSDALSAQLTYGLALKHRPPVAETDIQDRGILFRITLYPLRLRL